MHCHSGAGDYMNLRGTAQHSCMSGKCVFTRHSAHCTPLPHLGTEGQHPAPPTSEVSLKKPPASFYFLHSLGARTAIANRWQCTTEHRARRRPAGTSLVLQTSVGKAPGAAPASNTSRPCRRARWRAAQSAAHADCA